MNKVPNLRFSEFSGEWEHKYLNEIVERITRKNKGLISKLPLTISAQYGLVDQETFFNKTVASKNLEGYYLLKNGEFAYNKSYSNGYPWGAIKRLDKYECGVLSSLYICFKPYSGMHSDFLTNYFETTKWHKEVSMIAVEGARNHGLLNIAVNDFFETLHYVPNIEEQEKIGSFLSLIDKKIELQTEKVEDLKNYKKGIMQKIFSQELRFKDENGNDYPSWTKCKIYDCFVERSEKGFEDLELLSVSMERGVIKRSEIESKDNSSENKSNYKLVKKGDIVYNSMRMWQGASGLSEYEGIVSPAYTVLTPKKDIYSNYFSYLFKMHTMIHEFRKYSQGLTSDTWNLKYPQIKDIKVNVPSYEEQVKISQFFMKLDIKIEKEQDNLKCLIEYKKGLLQQMFI